MSTYHAQQGSSRVTLVISRIIAAKPWTATSIKNTCLRRHLRQLHKSFSRQNSLTQSLAPSLSRLLSAIVERTEILSCIPHKTTPLIPILLRVSYYNAHWIRSPETWEPDLEQDAYDQYRSLIHHLFAQYKMPAFLESAWLSRGTLQHKDRDWYCALAQGSSYKDLSSFPQSMSSRVIHMAQYAPTHLTLRRCYRWSQCRVLGLSDEMTTAILSSRMVNDFSNEHIWSKLLAKASTSVTLDPSTLLLIIDSLCLYNRDTKFTLVESLIQRTLSELFMHARKLWNSIHKAALLEGLSYHSCPLECSGVRDQLYHLVEHSWAKMPGIPVTNFTDAHGLVWRVHQLTSHLQLMAESYAMNHCVDQYLEDCRTKTCAIFRMTLIDDPEYRVTIEIDTADRTLMQVRGRWNRLPYPLEINAVKEWSRLNHLELYHSLVRLFNRI